jgi:hypothetical protein
VSGDVRAVVIGSLIVASLMLLVVLAVMAFVALLDPIP